MSAPTGGVNERTESLRRTSTVRLLSLIGRAGFSMVTAVATARRLGPETKGTLSSLLFVITVLSYICSLGLADATVVLVGRGRATVQRAAGASMLPIAGALVAGTVALAGIAWLAEWGAIWKSVAIGVGFLVASTVAYVLAGFAQAVDRVSYAATSWAVNGAVAMIATVLLVYGLELSVLGAVLAATLGASVMAVMLAVDLRRHGVRLRPEPDQPYLREALSFSSVNEGTFVLSAIAERGDLLVVYAILGETMAGVYSVALVLGRLSVYAASAVTGAVFQRLPRVEDDEARFLIARATRIVVLASALVGAVLALLMPFVVHLLFGAGYGAAVAPGVLLALGGPIAGMQLTLARSASARGRPRLYLASFGASVLIMLALDAVLVQQWDLVGAAVATFASSLVGAVIVVVGLRRAGLVVPSAIVPRAADLRAMGSLLRELVGVGGGRMRAATARD